jgi:hypothetical protein
MGKGKKKIKTRDSGRSKGGKRRSRLKNALRRAKMKLKRFERYKREGTQPAKGSKRTDWNTDGLIKYIGMLKAQLTLLPTLL